jgi:hypothetical protein
MNIFSPMRYFSRFRLHARAILLTLLAISSASSSLAQTGNDLFRGTWQIDTPNDGALILLVKRGGLASYFWGDNTDRTVYQGTWSSTDETATLQWQDGSQHKILRDALGFGISLVDRNQNIVYTVPAQQVPKDILGQWAKPPTATTEVASDRDKAKGYFGTWEISDDSSSHYVFIESDRSAASTWGDSRGLRGSWAKQGSELHIVWDSGHYSILRENERAYSYKRIDAGLVIEDDKTEFQTATRTIDDKVPANWLSGYHTEREIHTSGIAFSSRKNARAFYRGTWLVKIDENTYQRIELGRFGGITTTRGKNLEGSWRMDGQDIFLRWDNGSRQILSPVGHGFVLYEYKPGRPLDGVPTRTYPAAPADASKLAEHLQGRENVARQMLALSEAAGVAPVTEDAGWGRTFARWAWPFSEDEATASTDALLEEGYEETDVGDPWWWPFWSEQAEATKPAVSETEVIETEAPVSEPVESASEINATVEEAVEPVSEATVEEVEETVEEATEPKETSKRPSKKSWAWPF